MRIELILRESQSLLLPLQHSHTKEHLIGAQGGIRTHTVRLLKPLSPTNCTTCAKFVGTILHPLPVGLCRPIRIVVMATVHSTILVDPEGTAPSFAG
jgi:hypothetical protein